MRDRFPLVVIASLLLLGFVGSFLFRGARRASFADVLSTYRAEPDGARALYLLAKEGGLPVERSQRDFDALPTTTALVLLGVEFALHTESTTVGPLHFAGDGGVGDDTVDEEAAKHHGSNVFYAPEVSVEEREKLLTHVREGQTLIYVPWRADENGLLKELNVKLTPAEKKLGIRTLQPALPTPWTLGVERVETRVAAFLDLPMSALPLLEDPFLGETVAALIPYGQGQVILIGAPELATNAALARADNAQLWLSLLERAAGEKGNVGFDEFHHGFTNERSIAEFARRYGLHFAGAQLLLGVMLWAAALRRFGRPRLPPEEQRLGSTDALFAASRLYQEGGHRQFAVGQIVLGVIAELAPYGGIAPRSAGPEVAGALKAKGRPELAAGLTQLFALQATVVTDADVQKVAAHAAQLRAQLKVRRAATREVGDDSRAPSAVRPPPLASSVAPSGA